MRARGFTVVELIIVTLIIAVLVAIAIPGMLASRKNANEGQAIGALKTISSAQVIFRDADRDEDNIPDYGTLGELSDVHLIDPPLGSGRRTGYVYEAGGGSASPQTLWFAVANPAVPKGTGDRYFCINQRAVIFYTMGSSIAPNYVDCSLPSNLSPVE